MNDTPNEFQTWHGSLYPPTTGRVEVIRRNGRQSVGPAIAERWLHFGNGVDVVAWRRVGSVEEERERLRAVAVRRV